MMDKLNKWLDVAILLVLILMFLHETRPVNAQLAASSGFQYTPITTAANIQVKAAAGQLHNITINGGTLTGIITVVDTSAANCSGGTTVAIIAQPQVAGQNYSYDLQANNGICITTAAAVNATVTWR
jgi:hypothetical protein